MDDTLSPIGLSLFPLRDDLASTCTCPDDKAVPCVHGAAVHYVLASMFDDDPFLLFKLRGRERASVLAELSTTRAGLVDGLPIATLSAETFFSAAVDLTAVRLVPAQPVVLDDDTRRMAVHAKLLLGSRAVDEGSLRSPAMQQEQRSRRPGV